MREKTNHGGLRSNIVFALLLLTFGGFATAISIAQDVITATGNVSATGLKITGLNCTTNTNGGALTTDASGVVSCSDDDAGGGGGGGGTFLLHGGAFLQAASQTRYGFMQRSNQLTPDSTAYAVTRAGTLKNFYVTPSGTITSPGTATITVYTGATLGTLTASALTVTTDNMDAGAVVSDTSNTVSVSAGELVIVVFTSNASYTDNLAFNTMFELEYP